MIWGDFDHSVWNWASFTWRFFLPIARKLHEQGGILDQKKKKKKPPENCFTDYLCTATVLLSQICDADGEDP